MGLFDGKHYISILYENRLRVQPEKRAPDGAATARHGFPTSNVVAENSAGMLSGWNNE